MYVCMSVLVCMSVWVCIFCWYTRVHRARALTQIWKSSLDDPSAFSFFLGTRRARKSQNKWNNQSGKRNEKAGEKKQKRELNWRIVRRVYIDFHVSLTTINRSRKRKKEKKKKPRRSGKQTSRISSRDLGDGIKGKERKRVCASCMNPPFIDRSLPRDFTWRITLSCAPPSDLSAMPLLFSPLSFSFQEAIGN